MRGLAAALVVVPLASCAYSCDAKESPARADAPPNSAAAAPTDRLSPAVLDGVFPPRWRVGDHWRVRVRSRDQLSGPARWVTKEHDYRVAAIPGDAGGEYRVEAGWRGQPYEVITFSARDGSFSSLTDYSRFKSLPPPSRPDETGESIPYMRYGATLPVFAFPIVPPHLENPFHYVVPERAGNAGMQTIEVTPEGLRFIIREVDRLAKLAQIIEWRRGELWWSTARFWSHSDLEEPPENGIFSEEPRWTAELIRPEDPEPLPEWPWKPPR